MNPADPEEIYAAYLGLKNAHVVLLGSLIKAGAVDADELLRAMGGIIEHIDFAALPPAMADPMLDLYRNTLLFVRDEVKPSQDRAKPCHLRLIPGGKPE